MKRLPAFIVLTIVTLAAAILLAVTEDVTRGPIERAASSVLDASRFAVLPSAEEFERSETDQDVDSLYIGLAGGERIGYAATVTEQGFGGPVEVVVGADTAGELTGITVGGSAFAETPGLGSKVSEPGFTDQFKGKSAPFVLGETVDAVSGATVSSQTVVDAVNRAARSMGFEGAAVTAAQAEPSTEDAASGATDAASGATSTGSAGAEPAATAVPDTTASATAADAASSATAASSVAASPSSASSASADSLPKATGEVKKAGTAGASAMGFAGPVQVKLTVDAAGVITALEIGGARFAETEGLGAKVKDESFIAQFIGKKPPLSMTDIDAVSGATISTQAALNAVNAAYAFLCE